MTEPTVSLKVGEVARLARVSVRTLMSDPAFERRRAPLDQRDMLRERVARLEGLLHSWTGHSSPGRGHQND